MTGDSTWWDAMRELDEPKHSRPARIVLVVDHDGAVQMSTCPECTETPDDVERVLRHVIAVYKAHPQGGWLGDLSAERYDE